MSYKSNGAVKNASSISNVIKCTGTSTEYKKLNECKKELEQNISKIDEFREKCLHMQESLQYAFENDINDISSLIKWFEVESNNFYNNSSKRSHSEISEEFIYMSEKLMYNMHLDKKKRIDNGDECCDYIIWSTELKKVNKIKRILKSKYWNDLLCKNEIDLGMLKGRLSALCWIIGCDWGNFDDQY